MGLTKSSLENHLKFNNNINKIALIGNPNVGKSTVFNALTGLNQHTGNWPGKTVESSYGNYTYNNKKYTMVDLPGTYSLMSYSKEEDVSRDYIMFGNYDLIVIILDATSIERNLNLAIQIMEYNKPVIICLNLMDEAKKRNIKININKLSNILQVPVIPTTATSKKSVKKLMSEIEKQINNKKKCNYILKYNENVEDVINKMNICLSKYTNRKNNRFISIKLLENNENLNNLIYEYLNLNSKQRDEINNIINNCRGYLTTNNIKNYEENIVNNIVIESNRITNQVIKNNQYKISIMDKILTSKTFGIPIMLVFLCFILWLTIIGSNYPSKLLSSLLFNFNKIIGKLLINIHTPNIIINIITDGILKTLFWVISVMLPPMAIFFPLFTLLEDAGFLPRIAFNMDRLFKKAKCHGKQSLSMCMGFGCNACGVVGCRIIDSPRERLIAILTNSLVPCNGRFPSLIAIITMFFVIGNSNIQSSIILMMFLIFSIIVTLITSNILSKTLLKGLSSSFIMEMPPFRKPQIGKVIVRSIFDRTLFVLGRAISVAAPAGLIIWILSNTSINNCSIILYLTNFLDPVAKLFGLDGTILLAFILGFPANEIVIPIILMCYMKNGSLSNYTSLLQLKELLINNGWTIITALCTMVFIMFHFPCSTTLLTIKKETNSKKWTAIAFFLPTIIGLSLCFIIKIISLIL